MARRREPARLKRGKSFHKLIQSEWAEFDEASIEQPIRDLDDRRRRVDIMFDMGPEGVAVVEVKRSDWDRMKPHRVRPNALRHARQLWTYIETYLDRDNRSVCPGVIYEHIPKTPGRVEVVEAALHERSIQVVWHTESMEALKTRLGKS